MPRPHEPLSADQLPEFGTEVGKTVSKLAVPEQFDLEYAAGNYYEALGVLPTADSATISRAFRKLALSAHPDKGGDNLSVAAKQKRFGALNEIHAVLSNPSKRAEYDARGLAYKEMLESHRSRFDPDSWLAQKAPALIIRAPDPSQNVQVPPPVPACTGPVGEASSGLREYRAKVDARNEILRQQQLLKEEESDRLWAAYSATVEMERREAEVERQKDWVVVDVDEDVDVPVTVHLTTPVTQAAPEGTPAFVSEIKASQAAQSSQPVAEDESGSHGYAAAPGGSEDGPASEPPSGGVCGAAPISQCTHECEGSIMVPLDCHKLSSEELQAKYGDFNRIADDKSTGELSNFFRMKCVHRCDQGEGARRRSSV